MALLTVKIENELRRKIWRSLLILKSATLLELPGVVTGLTVRRGRSILRDLETHGYVGKTKQGGVRRPVYAIIIDSSYLPPVCGHCGGPFKLKACVPAKVAKKRDRERQREAKVQIVARAETAAAFPPEISEVHHDAA